MRLLKIHNLVALSEQTSDLYQFKLDKACKIWEVRNY